MPRNDRDTQARGGHTLGSPLAVNNRYISVPGRSVWKEREHQLGLGACACYPATGRRRQEDQEASSRCIVSSQKSLSKKEEKNGETEASDRESGCDRGSRKAIC